MQLFVMLVVVLMWASPGAAQPSPKTGGVTLSTVPVTAHDAAIQACDSQTDGCSISVPPDAANGVWFFLLNTGTACSAVTQRRGVWIAKGNGYTCSPHEPGGYCFNWKGQSCLILNAAGTAVATEVTKR